AQMDLLHAHWQRDTEGEAPGDAAVRILHTRLKGPGAGSDGFGADVNRTSMLGGKRPAIHEQFYFLHVPVVACFHGDRQWVAPEQVAAVRADEPDRGRDVIGGEDG